MYMYPPCDRALYVDIYVCVCGFVCVYVFVYECVYNLARSAHICALCVYTCTFTYSVMPQKVNYSNCPLTIYHNFADIDNPPEPNTAEHCCHRQSNLVTSRGARGWYSGHIVIPQYYFEAMKVSY